MVAQVQPDAIDVSISQPTDLDAMSPGTNAFGLGINASGQLAGAWDLEGDSYDAIRWKADGTPVVLHKATPYGQAFGNDLNDAGIVVGSDNEVAPGAGNILHAMRWNPDGSFAELPLAPGAVHQAAQGINNKGVIVGYMELANTSTRAVRWDGQGAHLLGTRLCCFDVARDVNDAGTAVGYVSNGFISPARWSASGALTILSLPPGDNFGFANAINNRGQVVGLTGFANGPDVTHHAVVWAPDGHPSVLPFSDSRNDDDLTEALGINDEGVIGGLAEDPSDPRGTRAAIWFKGRRIFVPTAAASRAEVTDLSADHLAGDLLVGDARHAVRWSFSLRFRFRGFFPPVKNPGPAAPFRINRVKAGQPIPVTFSLGGKEGLGVFAPGSPASKAVACTLRGTAGATPIRMGAGGLSYDAGSDRYQFVWQTDKSWGGTCRQLSVTLVEGTTHKALFRFTQ